MKNVLIYTAVALCLSLIIAFAIYFFMTANSDSRDGIGRRVDSIVFRSIIHFEGYPIRLFLKCYISGAPPIVNETFTIHRNELAFSDEPINAIFELIRGNPQNEHLNVVLVRERIIVISTETPYLRNVLIMSSLMQSESREVFDFMPMQGGFTAEDVFSLDYWWMLEGDEFVICMPYHLFDDHLLFYRYDLFFDDDRHRNRNLSHKIGHYYRIYGNMSEFTSFYENLGTFLVSSEKERLYLSGEIYRRTAGALTANLESVNGRIVLSFKEIDGQHYVAFMFYMDE